ncbi:uncharacterized protein LOC121378333 isoform X6 [Gigantopelta aegis]|uniref:uncharacterized protein LOC121378333 isoform X6 n=1 Tax=Gigantopelta aegis TaxID=1735272 RepID=UPI001B887D51|nr:uncharacterized protein LOC121378333 isoform X6 [Gigantopelta aegis]
MSGSAYHWDALRKERILQRKREALRRLQNPDPVIDNTGRTKKREEPLVIADQGEFVNLRSITMWTGTERNRRFYDHSRMGPVNDQSWRSLRRELKFREASLSYGGKGGLETYVHCDHCHFKPNYGRL